MEETRVRARRRGSNDLRRAPHRRGQSELLRTLRLRPRRRARPATAAGGALRLGFPGRGPRRRGSAPAGAGRLLGAVQALSERKREAKGAAAPSVTKKTGHGNG